MFTKINGVGLFLVRISRKFVEKVFRVMNYGLQFVGLSIVVVRKGKKTIHISQPNIMSGVDKNETRRIFQYERFLESLNLRDDGVIVEAGVGDGGGINFFLKLQRYFGDERIIYAFDSFEGFPQGHFNDSEEFRKSGKPGYRKYTIDFIKDSLQSCGVSDQELSRVKFFKGFIPSSFEMFPSKRVALLNCDLDLYEPTKETLNFFWNRMSIGGVVMLDEYDIDQDQVKWPGAKIAVDEFCREHGIAVHRGFGNRAFLKRA